MLGWVVREGDFFSLPCLPLHLSVVPPLLHTATQQSPLPAPSGPYTHLPLSHSSPAQSCCPCSQNALLPPKALIPLIRSVSSSGICGLKDGKSRAKGKGGNGKRSRGKKRKTKGERERVSHLWIHNYTIRSLSSWEMDLRSLHLTLSFHLYTVPPDGEWRGPVNWGGLQRQDVGTSHLAYMNTARGVSYFSLTDISSPFLLGNGFCPVFSNIQNGNSTKSQSSR